ncbi:MAG: ribosome-associated translation inhibitor RaiA [Clostridia bacterium]|nr:ribosome-associated translation inhibitor RaiA [Clostridia bacterium]
MNIKFTGRKLDISDSFKYRVEKKLNKFNKFFDDDAQANVTVSLERNRQTVEVTIKSRGMIFRAEDTAYMMEDVLDKVVDSLTRQIRKNKTRLEKRLHEEIVLDTPQDSFDEEEYRVVRSKRFPIKPLDIEEAVLQMNMLDHEFFMFRNADTNEINVVYRRHDGNYGVLEPYDE